MVLVEFKTSSRAHWKKYSFETIEAARIEIRKRFHDAKAVAAKVNGREVFAIDGKNIVYLPERK